MTETSDASQSRLLQTFLDLVRIDSPSKEEAGVAAYCAAALSEWGCSVRFDDTTGVTGSNTGNLIADLPGEGNTTLVFSAHMDTVEPGRGIEPVIKDGYVFSAGETILGADDKSGIAASIECIRRLVETGSPRPNIRCLFTVQEEVGLLGAKALAPEDAKGDLCLVLDADGHPGGIIIGAPTQYTFDATFVGRAAHAGVAPEKGISAIEMACDAVAHMELGRLDERTTANVGSIKGGRATNIVTPRVDLTGECRSLDRERIEVVRANMEAAMRASAEKFGGEVEIEWHFEYEGFCFGEDDAAVRQVVAACEDAGLEPRLMNTGGGSDANIISALGVPTVALSCGMQGVHGVGEQIAVEDLESMTELLVAVAARMATAGDQVL